MDILLVDDDETLRQSLEMLLDSEGYEVETASSGEEANEKAKKHYFDLVLCDVRMPGIDGIEAIRRLQDVISDAHFIVMTGYASEDAPINALKLGVDDYLTKPFDIPLFLEKLRAVARRRKQATLNAQSSVWKLLESLREHLPGLASKCEPVEETSREWAQSLGLSESSQEALQLGSWLYPLAVAAGQEKPSDEPLQSETLLDNLGNLLRKHAEESEDKLPDLLRAAVALHEPGSSPQPRNSEVKTVLEQLEVATDDATAPSTTHRLMVRTLGGFEVEVEGKAVARKAWQSANAKWLFVYLLSRGGQSVPEDRLSEIFWPGSPAKKAHRALVSSVHRARKALGDAELLARYDRSYGLQRDCEYWLDSEELNQTYKQATRHFYQNLFDKAGPDLAKVLELYRGPYLPDCHENWCTKTRDDIKFKVVDAAEKLAQIHLSEDPAQSERYCRRALTIEPTSEPAWSTLFKSLAQQGRRTEVETAFRECVDTLKERLGLKPGANLRQCYEECLE